VLHAANYRGTCKFPNRSTIKMHLTERVRLEQESFLLKRFMK
jgi:hypothetical protein